MNLDRLLAWIDERFGEDSIVIVTSTMGEELGEHGRVGHEYGLAQSLVHVPLYIRSPGLASGRTDAVVSLTSLFDFIMASALGKEPELESRPLEMPLGKSRGPSDTHAAAACAESGPTMAALGFP